MPITIIIGPTTGICAVEGTVDTKVDVDGEPVHASLHLKLVGHLQDFTPQARARAEQLISECDDQNNERAIHVLGGDSFDIRGQGAPLEFDWYQDYRLPSEVHLGDQVDLALPAHSRRVGRYDLTLVVHDTSTGYSDTDDIMVEVRDTMAPTLTPPSDLLRMLPEGETRARFSSLGKHQVSDACSDQVDVSHDAPEGLIFPAGATTVTWTADDGHGNRSTTDQVVVVLAPPSAGNATMLADASVLIRRGLDDAAASLARNEPVTVDLMPLTHQTAYLRITLADAATRNPDLAPVLTALGALEQSLSTAHTLLSRSRRGSLSERRKEKALDSITAAQRALDRVLGSASRPPSP